MVLEAAPFICFASIWSKKGLFEVVCCSMVSEPRSFWLKTLIFEGQLLQGIVLVEMVMTGCSFVPFDLISSLYLRGCCSLERMFFCASRPSPLTAYDCEGS